MSSLFYMIMAALTAIGYFILASRAIQKKEITESRVKALLIQSGIVGLFWMITLSVFAIIYLVMRARRKGDSQKNADNSDR